MNPKSRRPRNQTKLTLIPPSAGEYAAHGSRLTQTWWTFNNTADKTPLRKIRPSQLDAVGIRRPRFSRGYRSEREVNYASVGQIQFLCTALHSTSDNRLWRGKYTFHKLAVKGWNRNIFRDAIERIIWTAISAVKAFRPG